MKFSAMSLGTLLLMTTRWSLAFSPAPFGSRGRVQQNKIRGYHSRLFGVEGSADRFDMEELRQRIEQETNPYNKLFCNPEAGPKPADVHIILFKPDTDEEGAHTIEFPKGSGNNVILAFESKQECDNFAGMLRAQQFFDPTPQVVGLKDLENYCAALGVFVQVVPKGMHILPPSANVEILGHNPNLRAQQDMLDYVFEMGEADPEEDGVLVGDDVDYGGGSWE